MAQGFINTVPGKNRLYQLRQDEAIEGKIHFQLNISRAREFFSRSFCKGAIVNLDSPIKRYKHFQRKSN